MGTLIEIKEKLIQVVANEEIFFSTSYLDQEWYGEFIQQSISAKWNKEQTVVALFIGCSFFMVANSPTAIDQNIIRSMCYYLFFNVECGYSMDLAQDCTEFVISLEKKYTL